jgi:hypothetical protein
MRGGNMTCPFIRAAVLASGNTLSSVGTAAIQCTGCAFLHAGSCILADAVKTYVLDKGTLKGVRLNELRAP